MDILQDLALFINEYKTYAFVAFGLMLVLFAVEIGIASHSPRLANLFRVLCFAIPVGTLGTWFLLHGFQDYQRRQMLDKKVVAKVASLAKQDSPEPGRYALTGVARFDFTVVVRQRSMFLDAIDFYFPLAPDSRSKRLHIVGRTSEWDKKPKARNVALTGALGLREVPQQILDQLKKKSGWKTAPSIVLFEVNAPGPTPLSIWLQIGCSAAVMLLFVIWALRKFRSKRRIAKRLAKGFDD